MDKNFLVLADIPPSQLVYTITGAEISRKKTGDVVQWAETCEAGDVFEGRRATYVCLGVGRVRKELPPSGDAG